AEAIENALAALDRGDYATAQGLFEALAPPKPSPMALESPSKPQYEAVASPLESIPLVAPPYRRPDLPKEKSRGLRAGMISIVVLLIAALGAAAISASRSEWTFVPSKSWAIAGLASTVDLIKTHVKAITGEGAREEDRAAMRDLGSALTQVTIRLDQI